MWNNTNVVRRQKTRVRRLWPLLGFPRERQGRRNSLELVGLNTFSSLWNNDSLELPGTWPRMMKMEEYCLLRYKDQIEEVWFWAWWLAY